MIAQQAALFIPGAVLFFVGAFVYYALRGPFFELPHSLAGVLMALAGVLVLGQLSRLAALAVSWGIDQFFSADIFQERAPHELVDELSPRRLGPELQERLAAATRATFGVALPRIGRQDDEASRDAKARALDEVLALAHARAGIEAPSALAVLEARVEGARALAAALLLSAGLALATAVHDIFFARAIAHAFSSFSIVVLGVLLAFAALAAVGWARSQARRLALFLLLLIASSRKESEPASLTVVGKDARESDAAGPS